MLKRDNNAGLYLTIAFHLLLIIILLISRIDYMLREETSFILDFTKEELLEEIARQEKLDAAKREAEANMGSDDVPAPTQKRENKPKEESYKGPSVISYLLPGRKSMSLPIPVYKCVAGGDVAVAIVVDRKGYVKNATVIPHRSSADDCLQEYAIRAAKSSRFTASADAPDRQTGEIVYRFIAQ